MTQRELPLTRFGEWLEDNSPIPLSQLAKHLGCPSTHPFQWMTGRRKPTPKQIEGLADIYRVTPDDIYAMLGKIPPDIEQGLKDTTPDVFRAVRMYL